jgi:hypothetical protein
MSTLTTNRERLHRPGDELLRPSQHAGIWSYDDVRAAISLARSCMSVQVEKDGIELPTATSHPVPASDRLRATRQKYLP